MTNCVLCGGPVVFLGQLGRIDWFRCRNCGAEQFSEETTSVIDPSLAAYLTGELAPEPTPDPDDLCDCGHKAKHHYDDGCHVYTNESAEHPVCRCNGFDVVGVGEDEGVPA